jgi:predicted enzyme related to lactoylglutathione lyase
MVDQPPAVPLTSDEIRANMADEGFALEVLDLGERAATPSPGGEAPSVGYFTVDVPDGSRAAAFYGALLGWDARTGSQPGGFHVENISPPGGINGNADGAGVTIYFRVDDVAAAAARVRELGGRVLSEQSYPSGANASCLDDQGVPFQLWHPAPGYE